MQKIWAWIKQTWKDPVWSKVIAAGIIGAIVWIWDKSDGESFNTFKSFIKDGLIYEIPIYYALVAGFLLYGVYFLYFFIKGRKITYVPVPLLNEQVGDYLFGDLLLILSKETLPLKTRSMEMNDVSAPEDDLLTMFEAFYTLLNRGVSVSDNYDDFGYLWGVLAPRFCDYGLVKIMERAIYTDGDNSPEYVTSDMGKRFHALLQKYHLQQETINIT